MKRPSTTTQQIKWDRQRKAAVTEHRRRMEDSKARGEITRLIEQDAPAERVKSLSPADRVAFKQWWDGLSDDAAVAIYTVPTGAADEQRRR